MIEFKWDKGLKFYIFLQIQNYVRYKIEISFIVPQFNERETIVLKEKNCFKMSDAHY